MNPQAARTPRTVSRALFGSSRLRRGLQLCAAVLALSAAVCKDSTGPEEVGVYTLATVNGQTLPATVVDVTVQGVRVVEVANSGQLELRSDNTFTVTLMSTTTTGSSAPQSNTDTNIGTWSRSGNTITFLVTGDDPVIGTFSSNSITVTIPSELELTTELVFRK